MYVLTIEELKNHVFTMAVEIITFFSAVATSPFSPVETGLLSGAYMYMYIHRIWIIPCCLYLSMHTQVQNTIWVQYFCVD